MDLSTSQKEANILEMRGKSHQKRAGITPARILTNLRLQQISWTIFKYDEVRNISVLRRAFAVKFFPKHSHMVPSYMTGGH